MHIQYMVMDAPQGSIFIAENRKGLVWISFGEDGMARLVKHADRWFPGAQIIPSIVDAYSQLEDYFNGGLKKIKTPLDLRGTDFQLKVWRELKKIPYGKTKTYGQLAAAAGSPKAARAAGAACGANPIPIVIPCHRVLDSGGGLHGYGGGLNWKRWLLNLEGANFKE